MQKKKKKEIWHTTHIVTRHSSRLLLVWELFRDKNMKKVKIRKETPPMIHSAMQHKSTGITSTIDFVRIGGSGSGGYELDF